MAAPRPFGVCGSDPAEKKKHRRLLIREGDFDSRCGGQVDPLTIESRMDIRTSLTTYYADRAHEYERIYDKPERQADLQQLHRVVQSRFRDLEVLELACGTGYWTELLASSAAWVFATDINEKVLTLARAKPVDRRRVVFQREDAYALPVLPRKFTGSFAGFWWSHLPRARIQEFLRGFHRVLSPGASVMFIDNAYVEGSSTPISRTAPDGDTYQLRRLDDGSTHEVIKNFPTKGELIAAVDGSAKDVQIEFLRYYWVLQYTFAH